MHRPTAPPPAPPRPATDFPVYWFVRLERAVGDGDFAAAAEAQRQLERLGVRVRYGQREAPRAS